MMSSSEPVRFLLLTHSSTDVQALESARRLLPPDFPSVATVDLTALKTDDDMTNALDGRLDWRARGPASTNAPRVVIVVRLLGRGVPGFQSLLDCARERDHDLIVVSGIAGSREPDLTAMCTVSTDVVDEVIQYFQADGYAQNMANLFRCLADRLLAFEFGYESPVSQPNHGLYHPRFSGGGDRMTEATSLYMKECERDKEKPLVGIIFYRCHFLSGNTSFVDAMIDEVEVLGCNGIGVFTESLREDVPCERVNGRAIERFPTALTHLLNEDGDCLVDVLISTMAFAMGEVDPDGPTLGSWCAAALEALNVPVLQAITSVGTQEEWEGSDRGLGPLDTAMNVAIPEFDGRLITVPVSFMAPQDESNNVRYYEPVPDRCEQVARQAARLARLRHKPNCEKKIAFILTNSSGKAQRIGDAVGLDTPASLMKVFEAMKAVGYNFGSEELPPDGDKLIQDLVDRCSYDETVLTEHQLATAAGRVSTEVYEQMFESLPACQKQHMAGQWGAPPGIAYVHNDAIALSGLEFGNIFLALQPPRGYGMDPDKIYHTPDLPPPHNYFALYRWLRDEWNVDGIVHMGKHGTLEWLPGKGIGLSSECYPDTFLDDIPLVYPFIINDPGEGMQSKRRAHACIIDHLTPPMTTADGYGELNELMHLVDEYYQVEIMDPSKLPLIQKQIWALIEAMNLNEDLRFLLNPRRANGTKGTEEEQLVPKCSDHTHGRDCRDRRQVDICSEVKVAVDGFVKVVDDSIYLNKPIMADPVESHPHDHSGNHGHHHWHDISEDNLAKMEGKDFAHLIEDMDGYLCELAGAQIRNGLHSLGEVLQGDNLIDMLQALTRLPNLHIPSLREAIAAVFSLDAPELLSNQGSRLKGVPSSLIDLAGRPIFTAGDAVETIDELGKYLLTLLNEENFRVSTNNMYRAIHETFPFLMDSVDISDLITTLEFICETLVPSLGATTQEISHLIAALNGEFVPPGPSGSPTRGMAHLLPTGRNFYSVDPQALPSHAAWQVGVSLANELLSRYQKETDSHPEHVAISVWGTAAMRTHGDDIAQIFALLGIRPKWQTENHRVIGVELIPLGELGRPRIDVTCRISGFFRDAFPHLICLLDNAINMAIDADEPLEQNFIRKHYLEDISNNEMDETSARYRVFGCPPGAYGIGLLDLIESQNWKDDGDFATCYVNWGGYAYSSKEPEGVDARSQFTHRLTSVEVAIHNQDDREHDIFDSDDYFQFHGGMIATIRALSGKQPRGYFGDTSNPAAPKVRDVGEETLRVYRTRVVNPKWLESIQRHGYKGASEMAATVDYLFGFDATANVMRDFMYEQVAQSYALDEATQKFYENCNPWALRGISERLLEAAERELWEHPDPNTIESLKKALLDTDSMLEGRSEPTI